MKIFYSPILADANYNNSVLWLCSVVSYGDSLQEMMKNAKLYTAVGDGEPAPDKYLTLDTLHEVVRDVVVQDICHEWTRMVNQVDTPQTN